MPLNHATLMQLDIPLVEQQPTKPDTMLHALGIVVGSDSVDSRQWQYASEKHLRALPTMAHLRLPDPLPDQVCDIATLAQSALIHRLMGDYNPLHAGPGFAKDAGFDRPILHGRATFGIAGHAILKTRCDDESSRLRSMEARFLAPVYPGETACAKLWKDGPSVMFHCTVEESK